MTTEIKRSDVVDDHLYINPGGLWIHHCEFCHRHHEGVWNSRVLAFVPQPRFCAEQFSDGTPVASYEQFN